MERYQIWYRFIVFLQSILASSSNTCFYLASLFSQILVQLISNNKCILMFLLINIACVSPCCYYCAFMMTMKPSSKHTISMLIGLNIPGSRCTGRNVHYLNCIKYRMYCEHNGDATHKCKNILDLCKTLSLAKWTLLTLLTAWLNQWASYLSSSLALMCAALMWLIKQRPRS